MADYECYPLWESEGRPHNVNPFDLSITEDLANALIAWGDQYTATLDRSIPKASGFPDASSAEVWLRTGAALATQLRQQGFCIDYFHDGQSAADPVA